MKNENIKELKLGYKVDLMYLVFIEILFFKFRNYNGNV